MGSQSQPLVIFVTGVSGAGQKTAMNALEDVGVYSIDNLPLNMVMPALKEVRKAGHHLEKGIAFGIHIHESQHSHEFLKLKKEIEASQEFRVDSLFLTATDDVLELRFNANRRRHPLFTQGSRIETAIKEQRVLLKDIEEASDLIIDTSYQSPHELSRMIENRYHYESFFRCLYVTFISYGFKYGSCQPVDGQFDVRFLKNPYFEPSLRAKTGLDQEVRDYVFSDAHARAMLDKLTHWHRWILPRYYEEGKHYLRIGIGCTGGQHRSVSMVEELYKNLKNESPEHIKIQMTHRELRRKGIVPSD